jgi:uncharacterized RDD family membrane protein YckC
MIVTACFLPFTGGEAVTWDRAPLLALPYWAALVVAILAYFGLPWTQRGQTLGMASWRARSATTDSADVAGRGCAIGREVSPGAGWLGWVSLFDRERRTRMTSSHFRVVVLAEVTTNRRRSERGDLPRRIARSSARGFGPERSRKGSHA